MSQDIEQNPVTNELLSLRNDAVLKLFYTRKENEQLLRKFLKSALKLSDDSLSILDIKNSNLTKEDVQDKDYNVDIHLTSATGELIIVEMQKYDHAGFEERMVAYNSRDYSSQLRRGEDYAKLKSTISLVIVDFNIFKDTDEFYEHIFLRRENRKIFTNAQQYIIIDLTKIPKEGTDPLHLWGRLFKVETEEELRMLMETSEEMREAGKKLLELSADKEAQAIAQARKDALWARNHMMACLQEETEERVRGEERIKAEAEKDELKEDIAKRMLAMGLSIEDAAKAADLDYDIVCKF